MPEWIAASGSKCLAILSLDIAGTWILLRVSQGCVAKLTATTLRLWKKMLIPFEELWDRGLLVLEFGGESNILHKVEYTNDTNLLFPKTLGLSENGDLSVNHNAIGLHKAMSWAYQNE